MSKRKYTEAEQLERDKARYDLKIPIPKRRLAMLLSTRSDETGSEALQPTHPATTKKRNSRYWNGEAYKRPIIDARDLPVVEQFQYLKSQLHDDIVPGCQKNHRMLLRHIGMFYRKLEKQCLCCSADTIGYTAEAYRWLVDNGFDDMIFEWTGPINVIYSGYRFRYDILMRMNNGDLVSVELDDEGHFSFQSDCDPGNSLVGHRRQRDIDTYNWALANGMKVLRISATTNIEQYLAEALPNGPDTVLDRVTFVGTKTYRYYYLDGVDLYCYENIDDLTGMEEISMGGLVQPS